MSMPDHEYSNPVINDPVHDQVRKDSHGKDSAATVQRETELLMRYQQLCDSFELIEESSCERRSTLFGVKGDPICNIPVLHPDGANSST